MKYYLVGDFPTRHKKSTKAEIETILKSTEFKLFSNLEEARLYAQFVKTPKRVSFQRVISETSLIVVHADLLSNMDNYEFNNEHLKNETLFIKTYHRYLYPHDQTKAHKFTFLLGSEINFNITDFNINAVEFPRTNDPVRRFDTVSLPFFRALNPISKNSGIAYCGAEDLPCQGKEMIDYTVRENIEATFKNKLSFSLKLGAIFEVLVGEHFDLWIHGRDNNQGGAKGLLDFLIIPLIARKLIADTYLDERDNPYINALAWAIAVPIEVFRFTAGIALTLLISPVVALVELIRLCLPEQAEENTPAALTP